MNLNEPVHQDSTSGISEMLGQVSVGKRVLHLSSLQGETRKQRYSVNKCLCQSSPLPSLYAISVDVCNSQKAILLVSLG